MTPLFLYDVTAVTAPSCNGVLKVFQTITYMIMMIWVVYVKMFCLYSISLNHHLNNISQSVCPKKCLLLFSLVYSSNACFHAYRIGHKWNCYEIPVCLMYWIINNNNFSNFEFPCCQKAIAVLPNFQLQVKYLALSTANFHYRIKEQILKPMMLQ